MRAYYHTVGFAVGLTAVVALGAVDGALLMGSSATFGWNSRVYALVWLLSYLFTAAVLGEYVVNVQIRKRVFVPLLFIVFTALLFWAFYREENTILCFVFCLLGLGCMAWSLSDMIKHAFYACFLCFPIIGWYAFLALRFLVMSVSR